MIRLRRISIRTLDVEFPIGRGLRCRVLERPGLWMEDHALERVVSDLRSVVRATVRSGTLAYGALTGERERLVRSVLTIVYEQRRPLAFSAMTYLPVRLRGRRRRILHLGLALVHPDGRQRHLSLGVYGVTMLLLFLRGGLRPIWVTNVTQVPAAIGRFAGYFDDVYPALGGDARTPEHYALATEIMTHHRAAFGVGVEAHFDSDRFVIEDAYTGGSDNLKRSYAETAKHRRPAYGQLCRTELDYARGDDFLQIGRYTAHVILRGLVRRLRHHPAVAAVGHTKTYPAQPRHDRR
jgi:hypothetical protein